MGTRPRILFGIVAFAGNTALVMVLEREHIPTAWLIVVAVAGYSSAGLILVWPRLHRAWRAFWGNENKADKNAAMDALPVIRPIVTPTRYGKSADGYTGLFVKNDGDPAFNVSISEIRVGQSHLEFWNELPRFDKSDGERLLGEHITTVNGSGTSGVNALRDEMIRANLESVIVRIRYMDLNRQWYVTNCELSRDSQLGIRAGFLGQELAAPPLDTTI
jgi:hypothetical protein